VSPQSVTHDFVERLNYSHGVEIEAGIRRYLMGMIPGAAELVEPTTAQDKSGVDLWVRRYGLPPIGVDFKHRSFCPIEKYGTDDACVEICSVMINGRHVKDGWTIDTKKRTDLVVYTWPSCEGRRRFWVLWFPLLQAAAIANRESWVKRYRSFPARNDGYQTISIYPERQEIAAAMHSLSSGVA